ncbi:metallophosphatase domain-containing protein [Megavirus chiliensis]|uniref:Metallo-dependent phosphatase n=2 Tax=Megamimivirinae TaxID=3044648 RepID=A0A2L2DMQ9_MIMIV|nr:metallo-phosphoesterase [Megavirus chiliensis]AEQ32426.1 metallophosphatase domain-containing protein [Megavirus chiliensis]AVG47458.1 metallo-dependent phosphatase [Acanthamoeba polyphaga mimivirus]
MRILRYVSDLHLEMLKTIEIPKIMSLWNTKMDKNDENYLALVGDIGNPFQSNLYNFFEKISPKYDKIFYVPGNHEYYNINKSNLHSIEEFQIKISEICQQFDNIILMDNNCIDLGDIIIIGSTLWSHIPDIKSNEIMCAINDYHYIKKYNDKDELVSITTQDTNEWNTIAIEYITKQVELSTKPCIILTHHAPLFNDTSKGLYLANHKYTYSPYNMAFHNDLKKILKKPIILWIYGHTHHTSSFTYSDIIITTNQLGYAHELTGFNSIAYYDLDEIIINDL